MRKVRKWMIAVAVVALSAMASGTAKAQRSVSLQVFYDELQPYGTWVDHGQHGYVWMPDAGPDFVPYASNGYWVQTGYGNTWVSNYSWGWAPFHYGRWFYDDFYGWLWVPDTNWGPAWVTWRSGGGYYGWAPLMPGLSVSMNVGYYNRIPHNYWNFVPYRYVMYRQVYRHCVPRPRVGNVINHTTVIVNNNYYDNDGNSQGRGRSDGRDRADYFTGPSRAEIEKRNGERVPVYEVHDRNRPGQTEVSRSSVSLYKPNIERSSREQALPSQFTRDNAQGRENIAATRSRQLGDARSGNTVDNNREATRSNENAGTLNRSGIERLRQRENSDDLRREETPERTSSEFIDGTRTRSVFPDRSNRDADFNRMQQQREAEQLRPQQNEVQQRQQAPREEQMQRFRQQRQQEERQPAQPAQQRRQLQERQLEQMNRTAPRESNQGARQQQPTQRQPEQFRQPQQREHVAPRQTPSRQPAPAQQRTAPSRQFTPSQQRTSQPRMSGSPTQQYQRSSGTRNGSSQRSRE